MKQLDPDAIWFFEHPARYARIRKPMLEMAKNRQRAVGYMDENEHEFRTLGDHDRNRRRIIVWRMPADNIYYDPAKPQLLKIPYLLFADESVEDTDEILLPLIHDLMINKFEEMQRRA